MDPRLYIQNLSPQIEHAVYKYSQVTHNRFTLIDATPFTVNPALYPDAQVNLLYDTYNVEKKFTLDQVFGKLRANAHSSKEPLININIKGLTPHALSMQKSFEAARYAVHLNPTVQLEIGTGMESNIFQLRPLTERFVNMPVRGCVVNTGALVKDFNQVRSWNRDTTRVACQYLASMQIYSREHESDYLTNTDIQNRQGILTALTLGQELGVAQAEIIINLANRFRVPTLNLQKKIQKEKEWRDRLFLYTKDDKQICNLIAMPDYFTSPEYLQIYKSVKENLDPDPLIEQKIISILDRYVTNFL